MTDINSLIRRILKFREEAERITLKQKPPQPRVDTEEKLYNRLSVLNLKQDDIIRQAIRCIENGTYRAAHTYAWAAMADYLQARLAEDEFKKLSQVRPKWGINSLEELRENIPEFQIIEAFRACGYCGKTMEKTLKGFLNTRHECAHPSDYYPDYEMTQGYLFQILERFRMLEARRRSIPELFKKIK